jgi:hypothetical protein
MLVETGPDLPPPDRPTPLGAMMRLCAAAQAAAWIGAEGEARRLYTLIEARTERLPIVLFDVTITHRIAGMAAATAGLWEESEHHFVEAHRIAREYPNRWDAPRVDLWHGKMLLDRGKREETDRARQMISAARDEFERRGMPVHIRKADELLAR